MQTPTPPTRPVPPKSPSRADSATANTPAAATSVLPSSTSKVSTPEPQKEKKLPAQEEGKPTSLQSLPKTSQEDHSQATLLPAAPASPAKPSFLSFTSIFLGLLVLFLGGFYLWKNKFRKQRTILNYTGDSHQDLINLMNSPATAVSTQTMRHGQSNAPKIKSNFEVRI